MSAVPFLMAKAHANRSRSPTAQHISNMLNSSSVSEVETVLLNTSYGSILNDVRPSVDLAGFEKAMRQRFANLIHLYQRSAPSNVAQLINAYKILIDAENLDLILKSIVRGNISDELEELIIPVGKFGMAHYRRMMGSANVSIAADFITYPSVKRAVKEAIKLSEDPDDQIFHITSAVNHASFGILNDLIPHWVRHEVEILNLETICRAINLGIDAKHWMVPIGGVINRYAKTLMSMKSPREVLTFILPHFPVKVPVKTALAAEDKKMVDVLEDTGLFYLYRLHKHRFYLVNRNESVLDFLAIKKAELEDITRILFSKIHDIPPEEIGEMLYPIYKR